MFVHVEASTAQQSVDQLDGGVLRVDTRLVLVDVIVRDDAGPVLDLVADDFRLFDDGVEQRIEVFSFTSSDSEDALSGPLPEGVVSNRYDRNGRVPNNATVVLIDRLNTDPFSQPFVDLQVKEFLRNLMEGERVAIYELTNTLRLIQDYTSDPALIRRAMDNSQTAQTIGLAGSEATLDNRIDPELLDFLNGTSAESGESYFGDLVERTYLQVRADTSASALEAITARLERLPGRKSIVWLSGSFPFSFKPHQHNSFNNFLPISAMDRMEDTGRILTDANIAIYPVAAGGLGSTEPAGLDLMMELAEKTGGRVSFNTNALASRIQEAVDDSNMTYTLGFYANQDALDSRFHELKIEVDRDDVGVQHREGYFGFGAAPTTDTRPTILEQLFRPINETDIGLFASVLPNQEAPGTYTLGLQIDLRDLSMAYDGEVRTGSFRTAMFFAPIAEPAILLPAIETRLTLDDDLFQRLLDTGYNVYRVIETEGRTGWLRVVVRNLSTGAAGSLQLPLGIE